MNIIELTQQTLQKATEETKKSLFDPKFQKQILAATGLVGLQLEAPAKQLVPLMSPFRQRIPRKLQAGADAAQWRAITGVVQNAKFSTTELLAANGIVTTVASKSATYKEVGTKGEVSRKAIAHGVGFEDVKAREVANALLLAMKLEEQAILGGNITALTTPGAPAVAVRTTGGSIGAQAGGYDVRIAALTLMATNRIVLDRPKVYDGTDADVAGSARYATAALANPAVDGWSTVGALTNSGATTGSTNSLRISWTPVNGAAAYAIFVSIGAGTPSLEAIVTQANVTLTSLVGGGVAYNAANLQTTSADANIFNGIIPLIFAEASAYKKNVAGKLSTSGSEIVELQDAFQSIWDQAKIDEFDILVGGVDSRTITKLLTAAGGGPTIFVSPSGDADRMQITQGYHVGFIVNAVTGKRCTVDVLPWLPGGMILILPTRIPYPMANVQTPFEIASSYGWEQIDYYITASSGPVSTFDVRAEEVLKDYFPGGCGLLHNVLFG